MCPQFIDIFAEDSCLLLLSGVPSVTPLVLQSQLNQTSIQSPCHQPESTIQNQSQSWQLPPSTCISKEIQPQQVPSVSIHNPRTSQELLPKPGNSTESMTGFTTDIEPSVSTKYSPSQNTEVPLEPDKRVRRTSKPFIILISVNLDQYSKLSTIEISAHLYV